MSKLAPIALALMACSEPERVVADLEPDDQIALCEDFRALLCAHPEHAAECEMSCWRTCEDAALGAIETECLADDGTPPITEDEVLACGTSGTIAACMSGGGCMIVALSSACP